MCSHFIAQRADARRAPRRVLRSACEICLAGAPQMLDRDARQARGYARTQRVLASPSTYRSQRPRFASISESRFSTCPSDCRCARTAARYPPPAAGRHSPRISTRRAACRYSSPGRSATTSAPPAFAAMGNWLASQKLNESMVWTPQPAGVIRRVPSCARDRGCEPRPPAHSERAA